MRKILRLFAFLAAGASTPLFAQGQPNTVLTSVDGLPWGATRAQVEARFGAPDSVHTRGDTVNLVYSGKSMAGTPAKMIDVLITPGGGMASVAYLIQSTPGDCMDVFDQAVRGITARPGLRLEPRQMIAAGAPVTDFAQACRTFAESKDFGVMVTQTLADPTGPANVFLLSTGSRRLGTSLIVQFRSGAREGRP